MEQYINTNSKWCECCKNSTHNTTDCQYANGSLWNCGKYGHLTERCQTRKNNKWNVTSNKWQKKEVTNEGEEVVTIVPKNGHFGSNLWLHIPGSLVTTQHHWRCWGYDVVIVRISFACFTKRLQSGILFASSNMNEKREEWHESDSQAGKVHEMQGNRSKYWQILA